MPLIQSKTVCLSQIFVHAKEQYPCPCFSKRDLMTISKSFLVTFYVYG